MPKHSATQILMKADPTCIFEINRRERRVTDRPLANAAATIVLGWLALAPMAQAAPIITTQPLSQTLSLGSLLSLSVSSVATSRVRYQWRLNGDNVRGATNATYSVLGLLTK